MSGFIPSQESQKSAFSFDEDDEDTPQKRPIKRKKVRCGIKQSEEKVSPGKKRKVRRGENAKVDANTRPVRDKAKHGAKKRKHNPKQSNNEKKKRRSTKSIESPDEQSEEEDHSILSSPCLDEEAISDDGERENMEDEMDAMKQVFLKISEKKFKQREDKKKACLKKYQETFRCEVTSWHKESQKEIEVQMDKFESMIQRNTAEVAEAKLKLSTAHDTYSAEAQQHIASMKSKIKTMTALLNGMDDEHEKTKQQVQLEFEKLDQEVEEKIIQKYRVEVRSIMSDKSYVQTFASQFERLMAA